MVETVDMAMLHDSMRLAPRRPRRAQLPDYADLASSTTRSVWDPKGTENLVQRMPAGPAVVITPWNAPFMLSTWKLAPAFAAGNSVIHKPAEWSPLSRPCSPTYARGRLPAGRVQPRAGHRRGGRRRARRRPRVRRISFTGSPETARHIGRSAAENIVPFTAELGGKGPLVVFADCDLDAAAANAAGGSTTTRDRSASPARACSSSRRYATSSSTGSMPGSTRTCSATAATRPDDRTDGPPRARAKVEASSSAPAPRATASCVAVTAFPAACTSSRR